MATMPVKARRAQPPRVSVPPVSAQPQCRSTHPIQESSQWSEARQQGQGGTVNDHLAWHHLLPPHPVGLEMRPLNVQL